MHHPCLSVKGTGASPQTQPSFSPPGTAQPQHPAPAASPEPSGLAHPSLHQSCQMQEGTGAGVDHMFCSLVQETRGHEQEGHRHWKEASWHQRFICCHLLCAGKPHRLVAPVSLGGMCTQPSAHNSLNNPVFFRQSSSAALQATQKKTQQH